MSARRFHHDGARESAMKVCFAAWDARRDYGGASIWLRRLLPYLQKSGIELEVHLTSYGGKRGENYAFFKEQGIPVRWMPYLPPMRSAVLRQLQFLEKAQPDVYVPFENAQSYYAAAYAKRAGISTVGFLISDNVFFSGVLDQFINGDPDLRVSAVVPVSSFLEARVSSTAVASGVIVRRIANGVPVPARTASLSGSVFRLVYTGRLVEQAKRVSEVARALCAVAHLIPNLEAWMTGEGEARPAVENIIREQGMDGRVHLLGRVEDIYDTLAQCHGLVLLSDYEGLPQSVLEAMATGVVPICLDTRSGIGEVIEHGVNGLIVKDRGADFCGTVRDLYSDPAKWRQLSLAARETVQQRYSVETCASQWINLLEDLRTQRVIRTRIATPQILQLPAPDPRFHIPAPQPPWKRILKKYIRSAPPLHRMAKAARAIGHNKKNQAGGLF
jgi:colanic acid/amylovoran biosynthesis glycosyltransferase